MLFGDDLVLSDKRMFVKVFYFVDTDEVLFAHPGWWTTHTAVAVVVPKATEWR